MNFLKKYKKVKILYLTDQVYLHGGIEKVLSQKANYFADSSGDEVFIVTYNQEGKTPVYDFSSKIIWEDLAINYEIGKSYFHPKNLKKIPKHISALKDVLGKINPDVVISSSFGPDFYFLPYIRKNSPKIKEFHGSRYFYEKQESGFKKRLLHLLNKIIEKKYTSIAVLNEDEQNFYTNDNIAVIPNPAEISDKRAGLKSKKIMAAGRISPVKNFGDLIEIFSKISKDFPEWELHFFGEDYLGTQQLLEHKIAEFGLQNQIKFKGNVPDLKSEMQNYSIYAMTSETECFPMVLLESLSIGLPIISYDCPTGPKYIVKNEEDSFLIPNKNLDIFTEKLKLLMENEQLRQELSKRGLENVSRFEINIVMKQWQNLFEKVSSSGKK
ncbi:Glycosyltransferase involved in cell wall bisynthesis [Halpernia humi]|uniref:Glycosyltransferase involved in cell wall bisynthesis n=1 Tax=Halpernia humi TaxID=493375 RepID=A0A1H6AP69_9FLAO|nr:Glycosyltransferase involved in cell wall bisynthesis [Halpernia humi]